MTNREFYTAVLSAEVADEVKAFAEGEIAKLDARNEKRRNAMSKTQEANEAIKADLLAAIAGGLTYAADLAAKVGISTQKASALCTLLVKDGKVTVSDAKVKGKGKVKAYAIAE